MATILEWRMSRWNELRRRGAIEEGNEVMRGKEFTLCCDSDQRNRPSGDGKRGHRREREREEGGERRTDDLPFELSHPFRLNSPMIH